MPSNLHKVLRQIRFNGPAAAVDRAVSLTKENKPLHVLVSRTLAGIHSAPDARGVAPAPRLVSSIDRQETKRLKVHPISR
ncbi:uncharacterized protein PHALS_14588 [Plasmopara halstedii]|uniref:Uncharacterized protein n=1 Tax=Plasmopara halstedii TaxID=4781 RepID=A0A0P1AV98_PLAHL|nr:uncharacterized protein PHALS_14588 [Plasmopara halstedii]CEG44876.1 hypothetical protein PHALS_14588 [Plasmopara halstedii]|eukprot:XP_024581245.1 hypothetical protein PHALS_14588 [Plasmopara halstedii]